MRKKRHPLSGAVYTDRGDGTVHVDKHGSEGVFDAATGAWISGELTHADPHMLLWVGGRLPAERARGPRPQPPELVHD